MLEFEPNFWLQSQVIEDLACRNGVRKYAKSGMLSIYNVAFNGESD